VMLTSFGLFWTGEGAGLAWPGSDVFILALAGFFLALALLTARVMRFEPPSAPIELTHSEAVGS